MELELLIKMKESQKHLKALEMQSSPKADLSIKKEQCHKGEIMRVHSDLDNPRILP